MLGRINRDLKEIQWHRIPGGQASEDCKHLCLFCMIFKHPNPQKGKKAKDFFNHDTRDKVVTI